MKEIDVPELFLLSSTGQKQNTPLWQSLPHTIKLMHVSMVAGWWVSVDFNSKYKILWGETRVLFMKKKKKKLKTRICIIIPIPLISD